MFAGESFQNILQMSSIDYKCLILWTYLFILIYSAKVIAIRFLISNVIEMTAVEQ